MKTHRPAPYPDIFVGAGLRPPHYPELLEHRSAHIQWFEIITENFLTSKGRPRWVLGEIRKDYPVAFHGVSLSIGSPEPLNTSYLQLLKDLAKDFDPFLISDHFCWTGLQHKNTHNLLPLPLTKDMLRSLVSRIDAVQQFLGRKILLENASAYMQLTEDQIPEWQFITEICQQSGCGLLLDLNNLYVTSKNFQFDPLKILRQVPARFVEQIHLAGHTDMGNYLFDTHSRTVQDPVWDLFDHWCQNNPPVPTMIEWDDEIPPLLILEEEVKKIKTHFEGSQLKRVQTRESQVEL